MNKLLKRLLLVAIFSITCSATAGESDLEISKRDKPIPEPNWSVLFGKPLRTTKEGNKQVDVFKSKPRRSKPLGYAWARGGSIDDTCTLIIWIRGAHEDKRIIYEGKKEKNLCTVYISNSDFEKQFRYCVLSGIKCETDRGFVASFGGGPAGDREEYWFEWGDPLYVKPDFYCVLK